MIARFRTVVISLSVVALVLTFNLVSSAGNQRGVITQKIDNSQLTTLAGNTRPEANALNDRGPVSADLPFEHNLLLLQRTPDQERQLEAFIEGQYNHASASYHHWLNAQQFGEQYGIADSDIQKITGWLESFGFRVDYVYSNKMVIDFSGTASQYEAAFHTQFHYYRVNGEDYVANASDPKIPAALAGVVAGPIYLNNFKPQAMNHRIMGPHIDPASGSLHTDYTAGGGYPLVPWDLQKIYNITSFGRHLRPGHDHHGGGRYQPVELPGQQRAASDGRIQHLPLDQ
jgi:subtilase family serine protease